MGDRCYMQVTCRRQDRARFEELGFEPEFEDSKDSPLITLADEEANYAHYNDMPVDIPYYGSNGSGGDYGPGFIACDGSRFAEVTGTQDGFVVQWDYETQQPTPKSVEEIRHYIEVRDAVGRMFKDIIATQPAMEQAVTS
jgi:hypothetical protein